MHSITVALEETSGSTGTDTTYSSSISGDDFDDISRAMKDGLDPLQIDKTDGECLPAGFDSFGDCKQDYLENDKKFVRYVSNST